MSDTPQDNTPPSGQNEATTLVPPRRTGLRLFRRLVLYHVTLVIALLLLVTFWPGAVDYLPIGGVTELVEGVAPNFAQPQQAELPEDDIQIVRTIIRVTNDLDRLGYARQLMIVLVGVWLLMLPVSWVHKGIHQVSAHDHSLDETTLILPGVVAAIVLVVQHSLALAFSLAGIVAGVQFRRALQDTFDALFILVAIGSGIAAGVKALEIAAVLTVFFSYATLYVYFLGDGLESDYSAQQKALKQLRKKAASQQPPGQD